MQSNWTRRFLLRLAMALPTGAFLQRYFRPIDAEVGEHDMPAEKRPWLDRELDRVGREHLLLLGPIRIAEIDLVQQHMRRPAPIHIERADGDGASGRLARPSLGLLQEDGGMDEDVDTRAGGDDQDGADAQDP